MVPSDAHWVGREGSAQLGNCGKDSDPFFWVIHHDDVFEKVQEERLAMTDRKQAQSRRGNKHTQRIPINV